MTRRAGYVVIGRNEGERLVACLASLPTAEAPVVYVDSGSSDDSVANAENAGARVVRLDMATAFTAARARNAGLAELAKIAPEVVYVQFIDGDCVLAQGWVEKGAALLDKETRVAAAFGRRRERRPDASVYNALCDEEWDGPPGDTILCGGDVMMRRAALDAVGPYRENLIAGEEPELCVRLRAAGWRIVRIEAEMTAHDAAIMRFGQWWRRTVRGGHAFAEVADLHRGSPFGIWASEARRPFLHAAPLALAVAATVFLGPLGLLPLAFYPVQAAVVGLRRPKTRKPAAAFRYAVFMSIAKFAEIEGVLRYRLRRRRGAGPLIEYKGKA